MVCDTATRCTEPYFLYRASDAGSLVALIGYPVLFEPLLALSTQATAWIGFEFLTLMIASAAASWLPVGAGRLRSIEGAANSQQSDVVRVRWEQRLAWMGLAFVPSGLLVACTTYLSTDIGHHFSGLCPRDLPGDVHCGVLALHGSLASVFW